MKYLLQIRFNGAAEKIAKLGNDEHQQVTADFETIRQLPGVIEARRLQGTDTAITVQSLGGDTKASPGLPVQTNDSLDGYYVFEGDLDAATALAARVPVLRLGGSVEIRPLRGD